MNRIYKQKNLLIEAVLILFCYFNVSIVMAECSSKDNDGWTITRDKGQSGKESILTSLPRKLKQLLKEKYPGCKILRAPPELAGLDMKYLVTADFDGDSWNDYAMVLYKINPTTSKIICREVVFLNRDTHWEDHILPDSCSLGEADLSKDYGGLYVESPNYGTVSRNFPSQKMLLISVTHNLASVYEFQNDEFVKIHQSD
jgi:hypothetical protein